MKTNIGIVGGGQLGRMLAFEAKKMGFTVRVIDPTPQSPAGQVSDEQLIADYNDEQAIRKLASVSDFLTFEIELANAALLDELASNGVHVNPSAKTLSIIKDKLKQKEFLKSAKLPVAKFLPINGKTDIVKAAEKFGYPLVLKARFDAYDGRGNALIKNKKNIDAGLKKLFGRELYIEQFVPFVKELAVMVARNAKGEVVSYPVVETIHKNNICHTVFAPARVDKKIQNKAKRLAVKTMKQLKGAGVFGIEMFLTHSTRSGQAKILINEIAPRVHNSGHYTIEACATSQFEQHIRAVTGLPLGKTDMIVPSAVMINILGKRAAQAEMKGIEKALKIPHVTVHIYGKAQTKPERKMGHITATGKDHREGLRRAKLARKFITI